MRAYEARVPEGIGQVSIRRYLARAFPLIPQHAVRDALKNRDVRQDGVRAAGDDPVRPGALIRLYTPFEAALALCYRDEHVALINKPAGLSSDMDDWGGMTVLSVLKAQLPDAEPRLCHRLDNQTCGLMILALDEQSESCLLRAFRDRLLDKTYQCLVKGTMRPEKGEAEAFLVRDPKLGRVRVVSHPSPEGRTIRTAWETVRAEGSMTRLNVTLLTGRTHQIRAHMAYLSHPVVGDDVYGDRAFNRRVRAEGKLRLCSHTLSLRAGGPLSYLDGRVFRVDVPF